MSTDIKGTPAPDGAAPNAADEIKNFKAEFNRKIENVNDMIKKQNEALLTQFQQMLAPKAPTPQASEDDLSDLMYKNPKAYTQRIKDEAKAEIRQDLDKSNAEMGKRQQAIQSLYKEFPELAHDEHELTKTALSKFDTLSKEYGNSPAAYKAAVAEAALELGIKPKSKRPQDDDSFSLSGSGSSSSERRKLQKAIDERTKQFAEVMGVDIKKVEERTKKRDTWSKYR